MPDTVAHHEVVKVALERIADANKVLDDYTKWHAKVDPEWTAIQASGHLDIAEPFKHLRELTLAFKANWLVNRSDNGINHSSQVPGYTTAFPHNDNSFQVLQGKAIRVQEICAAVLSRMDDALQMCGDVNPLATAKSTNAQKHLEEISLSVKAVADEVGKLKGQLPERKSKRDAAQNTVNGSQRTVDELKKKIDLNRMKSDAAFDADPEVGL